MSKKSRDNMVVSEVKGLCGTKYRDVIIGDDFELLEKYPEYEKYIKTCIAVHNSECLAKKRQELQRKKAAASSLKKLELEADVLTTANSPLEAKKENTFSFSKETLDKYKELIALCEKEEDVITCLDDKTDLTIISLLIYRDINELVKKISYLISLDPLTVISDAQKELKRLRMIFSIVKDYSNKKSISSNKVQMPTVILIEENDGNDVIYNYINNNRNVIIKAKKCLEKFFRGERNNVKRIKGKKEDLLETEDTNGTRLLFFSLGNNTYVLAQIFIKDKNKSTKIDGCYDKAISDYLDRKEYILANLEDEEFRNRQSELINKLFGLLNGEKEVVISETKV